jgi:hypothetical protein
MDAKPRGPASFAESTRDFKAWLAERVTITDADWARRERVLAEASPFERFRATFYRWAQWWPAECEDLDGAPQVLGVGDLHVENFGTWRDAEGRLVWGINDLDEACCVPYTHDLVRLAASARFAIHDRRQRVAMRSAPRSTATATPARAAGDDGDFRAACRAILAGYGDAIDPTPGKTGRRPLILAEDEGTAWLRDIVINKLQARDGGSEFSKFLESLEDLGDVEGNVPRSAWDALRRAMPPDVQSFRIGRRDAGLGSLGRQRFTAVVADWHGGILAREAKALAPSAWRWWTREGAATMTSLYETVIGLGVRSPDPWVFVSGEEERWLVRRLAPDSGRVKLTSLPKDGELEDDLLRAMGRETANVHVPLGNVWADFEGRTTKDPDWLFDAARRMAERVADDLHSDDRAARPRLPPRPTA